MSNLIQNGKWPKISVIGAGAAEFSTRLALTTTSLEEADGAIFIVSANRGIVGADVTAWRTARELYIPSIVVIDDLDSSEVDFEDMSLIAGKILDPIVTPYLVLHSDSGSPAALISLENFTVSNYESGSPVIQEAEDEHRELVTEFREEFLEAIEGAGEGAFEAGLIFPAIPYVARLNLGVAEIREYLKLIPTLS